MLEGSFFEHYPIIICIIHLSYVHIFVRSFLVGLGMLDLPLPVHDVTDFELQLASIKTSVHVVFADLYIQGLLFSLVFSYLHNHCDEREVLQFEVWQM